MVARRFATELASHRRIALDTSIFIYHFEANPKYSLLTNVVFEWLENAKNSAKVSTLAMAELLVPAYRTDDTEWLDNYHALITTLPNVDWIAVDLEIADTAARLRASHRLTTPDAIHAATAIHSEVSAVLTNDPVLKRVDELNVLILDERL